MRRRRWCVVSQSDRGDSLEALQKLVTTPVSLTQRRKQPSRGHRQTGPEGWTQGGIPQGSKHLMEMSGYTPQEPGTPMPRASPTGTQLLQDARYRCRIWRGYPYTIPLTTIVSWISWIPLKSGRGPSGRRGLWRSSLMMNSARVLRTRSSDMEPGLWQDHPKCRSPLPPHYTATSTLCSFFSCYLCPSSYPGPSWSSEFSSTTCLPSPTALTSASS